MRSEHYLAEELNPYTYRFFSVGRHGRFKLVVTLTPIDKKICNLGFGVWNEEFDTVDDSIETRNGDTDKILATVAKIALNFIARNPTAFIYATGSCAARTRKYQMGISKYLPYLKDQYTIQGLLKDKFGEAESVDTSPVWYSSWQDFRTGVNYDAFLLSFK